MNSNLGDATNGERRKEDKNKGKGGEESQNMDLNEVQGKASARFGLLIVVINLSFKLNLIYLCIWFCFSA